LIVILSFFHHRPPSVSLLQILNIEILPRPFLAFCAI
jgi:hypothetical protein